MILNSLYKSVLLRGNYSADEIQRIAYKNGVLIVSLNDLDIDITQLKTIIELEANNHFIEYHALHLDI